MNHPRLLSLLSAREALPRSRNGDGTGVGTGPRSETRRKRKTRGRDMKRRSYRQGKIKKRNLLYPAKRKTSDGPAAVTKRKRQKRGKKRRPEAANWETLSSSRLNARQGGRQGDSGGRNRESGDGYWRARVRGEGGKKKENFSRGGMPASENARRLVHYQKRQRTPGKNQHRSRPPLEEKDPDLREQLIK